MSKRLQVILSAALVLLLCGSMTTPVFAQKVSKSVGSVTLTEGQSAIVTLQLDAPIICSGSPSVCDVEISFAVSDPSQVSVSPVPIIWANTDWAQSRTVTITALDDGLYSGDRSISLTATVVSAAVYFSGFTLSLPVTVHNSNPAPAPAIIDKILSLNANNSSTVDVLGGITNSPNANTLAVSVAPSHGSASVMAPNITYTPTQDYSGSDSLTYRVCSSLDSSVCKTAVLSYSVTINAPNTGFAPVNHNKLYSEFTLLFAGIILVICSTYWLTTNREKTVIHKRTI